MAKGRNVSDIADGSLFLCGKQVSSVDNLLLLSLQWTWLFYYFRSQDDPFVLYAALYSGLGCDFMSGDLMRDHRFKLATEDVELRKIFLKWQRTHQLEIFKVWEDRSVTIKVRAYSFVKIIFHLRYFYTCFRLQPSIMP
jgi:hypothetical protein